MYILTYGNPKDNKFYEMDSLPSLPEMPQKGITKKFFNPYEF